MPSYNEALYNDPGSSSSTADTPLTDLLYAGLRIAGITLAPGRGPSPDQLTDALGIYRRMISGWRIEPLVAYRSAAHTLALIAGTQSYTLDAAEGQFLAASGVSDANLIDGDQRPRVAVLTQQEWAQMEDRASATGTVAAIYLDRTHPLPTVYVTPIPVADGTMELHARQKIAQVTELGDVVSLPDGYEEAIVFNLAVRIAMQFPTVTHIAPDSFRIARESFARIEASNCGPAPLMECDSAVLNTQGTYDILTNRF